MSLWRIQVLHKIRAEKEISELKIKEAWEYMAHHNIDEIVIHAPYIINLANTIKPETYEIAEKFFGNRIGKNRGNGKQNYGSSSGFTCWSRS